MVEAKDAKLPGVIKEARESGFEMLARNAGVIATKCAAPIPYIGALSTDEQSLLVLTRDRFVHGYLDGTTKPSRNLKLLIEDQVRSRPFSRDYLTNLTGKKMSLDMIRRLRWKFFSSSGNLWSKLQELFVDHDWLEQALMDDWPIYLDSGIK
jgi:hypothetical protein